MNNSRPERFSVQRSCDKVNEPCLRSKLSVGGNIILTIVMLTCCSSAVFAQLSGVKYIPGDYATIGAAVSDLNSSGVGAGGVTFNVAADYIETITATISVTASGTIDKAIIFRKDPATAGANPLVTAYTGGTGTPSSAVQDGVWRLVGSDYVTIDGINLSDNPENITNPSTMEYGYALYKAGSSDGCQYVTIQNCVITLTNINNASGTAPMVDGSTGIITMNSGATTATTVMTPSAGGTNSYNKFYKNTIQHCNTGIAIVGFAAASPYTLADVGNDVGGISASTGNTVINFGGASGALNAATGIRTLAQHSINISYNAINNNNGTGTNHPAMLQGIYTGTAAGANATINHNTVTVKGGGTTQNISGIENASGSNVPGTAVNINHNTITNSSYTTATTGGFYGIRNTGLPVTVSMDSNLVSNNSSSATTTGFFYGILNSGGATNAMMNSNTVTGNATAALTSGLFVGVYNSPVVANLSINNNKVLGNFSTALSGVYFAIYNAGAVTGTININFNSIGNNSTPAFTYNASSSGAHIFINNSAGAASVALSISNNDFQGINYAVAGTGHNTYISNVAATRSQVIDNNTFTSLTVNTSGNVTFIANSVPVPATGTQNVNNNAIVGSFSKTVSGGTVTLFSSLSSSVSGSIINNNNNNFSNITVTGTTVIAGWVNTDAGGSTKTIQNNVFSNWTGGTGIITGMAVSVTGTNNAITSNSINSISGAGSINGITTAAGNDRIYSNTIHTLVSTGTASTTVIGISVSGGTTKNIYQNTIYDLQGNSLTTGSVRGIYIGGGTTVNVYQNTIFALQANTFTTGSLSGIWVGAGVTIGVYRNKIYNLSSSSAAITTGAVYGILVSGSTASCTRTIRNNLVGDLRTTAASTADAIRGMGILSTGAASTINVYNNTVYLNAVSSGSNFGSTGIYHTSNSVATTATLDLRNNIITNTSSPTGTGITVAYRRVSATLTNYAATSNNNLFYAGTPSASRLIFFDATNPEQFLSTYKARVASRDAQSVTEDMITSSKLISIQGSSAFFLHVDPTKATQAESGGIPIGSVIIDFDGETTQGNTGYSGTGTAPDLGADETNGIRFSGLTGTYNVGAGQTFTSLTNADGLFANINSRGLSGNVTVNITSDLAEDGTNVLYQWIEQDLGNYTLTLQPDAPVVRIISGNVLTGLIRFSGADRVTIDGRNGGSGNYLHFRNTNTGGTTGTAFTFVNGATNNIIRYSSAEAYANATNGVILFGTSTIAGGNSINLISYCNINATVNANTGNLCIYSGGSTGNENLGNTISNNNIYNYRDRALDVSATGSSGWVISDNSFYNGNVTGAINYAAGSTLHGVRIAGGAGYSIQNNFIGGNAALATGTNAAYASNTGIVSFYGILLTTTSATPASNIKGNTVARITVSAVPTSTTAANVFTGIESNGFGISIGGSLPGDKNMIGSNTTNGSIVITTATTATNRISIIRGINCNSSGGVVNGNQVGGMDIQNIGTFPGPSTIMGISITHAIAPSQVNNNIIGSKGVGAASNSIRVLSTSTASTTPLYGISIGVTVASPIQVNSNVVQNMSHQSPTASGFIRSIFNSAAAAAVVTIMNDTITGNSVSATAGTLHGIYTVGNAASVTISNNKISGNAAGASAFYGTYNTGAPPIILINNNQYSGNTSSGVFNGVHNNGNPASITISNNTISDNATTGNNTFFCFINTGIPSVIAVTGNLITGNTTIQTSGLFYAFHNTGAVTGSINFSSNNIGNSTAGPVTFNAANTGAQVFINNTAGAASATLSISNNNFHKIIYNVASSGANTYILNSAATLSQAINGNTFTDLNVNTTNSITFISNNVVVPSTGTQNVNNNSISGTFTKRAGGTITLFTTTTAASIDGAVINNNNNNFSNISVTGTSVIAGWINTDPGAGTKTIQNNTFSNWLGGTGALTAMSVNVTSTNNVTTGNLINNISGGGPVTGITTALGNDKIHSNTIHTLSSTGAAAVTGIAVTLGTTKNIHKNKIYNLSNSNAGGSVNGILVSGGTTVNIYNNIIGDLRTPIASSGTDVIRGISVTSTLAATTINVYYNTIYLNAASTGTNFSTSAVYHLINATATTAALNLRNNSITNKSTPNGTGKTVAYRRSAATLTNYAATSNNNLFYAGTPGMSRLIFSDGANSDSTISAFIIRVANRDSLSVTEDLTSKFLSTTGTSTVFLHMDESQSTLVESGALNITGFTDDIDGQTRAGNAKYAGSSSSPDIGADEISGVETVPPTIVYTLLGDIASTTNRNVTGVIITDASGVNTTTGTKPGIYYKRYTDANVWLDNTPSTNGWKYTEATNSSSPFTFTIDYSLLYGGAAVTAGVIQYFIVAQDIATTANIAINSGTFATTPSSVALISANFPIGVTINSYSIPFSGTYNVGGTEVFTSLTKPGGVFAAINSAGLMGSTTFNIISDIAEDGTNALNQWTESGGGNYTLTIKPEAATLRTVSGDAAGGLIRLDGADRVTIDGSNGGSGIYLSFINTTTAGTTGTAFTFINGATDNSIRYCDVKAYADETNGVIRFGTGGNSNNLVDSCTIFATVGSNTGKVAIYSAGTIGNENSSGKISGNDIYNYGARGVDIVSGSTQWIISGNHFHNGDVTATIDYAASSEIHGIRVLGGSGYSILNNYIGGDEVLAPGLNAVYSSTSGGLSYQGILLQTSSSSPASYIKGNTVASMSIFSVPTAPNSNVFTGIATSGSGIDIGGLAAGEGNTIGSNASNGSIAVTTTTSMAANTSLITGINCASTGGLVFGNQVGGIDITNSGSDPGASAFKGLHVNSSAAPSQVNNNIIGSIITSHSIRVLAGSTAASTSLSGISFGSAVSSDVVVNGNLIQNFSQLSLTSSGSFTGINNQASAGVLTISNDTIQNILTTANASPGSKVFTGIHVSSASSITNSLINNISVLATGSNAQIIGIHVSGPVASTVSGNVVSFLSTASTKSTANAEMDSPAGSTIIGLLNATSVAGQIINNNRFARFTATSEAAVNTVVTGVAVTSTGSGAIFNNKFGTFTNLATGTTPAIRHMMAANGSFNVYNNVSRISNLLNTNSIKVYGFVHASPTAWNYFHNTIRVGGSAPGAALRSAAFLVSGNGFPVLQNNIFFNIRTGAGKHYAISNLASPASNWPASASDYNNFYSIDENTVAEWGENVSKTFTEWRSLTGGGTHSISNAISFITSTYDLEPDSITNCNFNNGGIPITTPLVIDKDLNNAPRSPTNPDLGAYEFHYTGFTITPGNNSPVCSGDSILLSVDAGHALSPSYSWTNSDELIVSTIKDPTVASIAGQYKITVTDSTGCYVTDSTTVSLMQRPTATLTGAVSICEGSTADLQLTVTGSGLISGMLNTGEVFSGVGPAFTISVTPNVTTFYNINSLSDSACSAIPADVTDTISIVVTQTGGWLGTTGSDWNDPANWCGGIPVSTTDVTIPGSSLRYPIMTTGVAFVNDITIQSGASMRLTNSTLYVSGSINNSGSFFAESGIVEMNGSSSQTIPAFTFSTNTLKGLTINNTAGVSLGGELNLTGVLTVANGSLNTADHLILKSSSSATARVAAITSAAATPINGKVKVERYVIGRRKYRLVTSGVTTHPNTSLIPGEENYSIWGMWQNQQNNVSLNTGTFITGGTSSDGFDTQTGNASLYTYNDVTRRFIGFTTANGKNTRYTPLKAGVAYYMFVYGDRTKSVSTSSPNSTVISATGTLLTGDQTYNTSSGIPLSGVEARFTLLGNPFASPIDWATLPKADISNTYWGWDPNLNSTGGYITVNTLGAVTLIAPFSGATGLNQNIQSGQGFFVQTIGAAPSLTIREQDKTEIFNAVAFRANPETLQEGVRGTENSPETPPNSPSLLAINLQYDNAGSKVLADGVVAAFGADFTNQPGHEDASKMANSAESIAIANGGALLSIDARQTPAHADTVFLNISRLTRSQYTLQIFAKEMQGGIIQPYIEDNYLGTKQLLLLNDTNRIVFSVSGAIAASSDINRFRIVFLSASSLPVTFLSINAKLLSNSTRIEWTVSETGIERYNVERSMDGIHFTKIAEVPATGNSGNATYNWLDLQAYAGDRYYRIRAIQPDGEYFFSKIVVIKVDAGQSAIGVFPNPVKNHLIHLHLRQIAKGQYQVRLFNSQGRQILEQPLAHPGGSSSQTIGLLNMIPNGVYFLEMTNKTNKYVEKIIVE